MGLATSLSTDDLSRRHLDNLVVDARDIIKKVGRLGTISERRRVSSKLRRIPSTTTAAPFQGAALGTVLAFMMAVIGLSLPEAVILRKVLTMRLILVFFGVVAVGIVIVGYVFNLVIPTGVIHP